MLADILLRLPLPSIPTYLTSWKPGVTPLSTLPVVATTLATYLGVVFGIKALQENRPPKKLNALFQIHNLILTSVSGLLFVLIVEEITPFIWNHGFYYSICGEGAWTEVIPVCSDLRCKLTQRTMFLEARVLLPYELFLQVS